MDPIGNVTLGAVFVAVGAAATLLMYYLWAYPYDKEKLKSEAPVLLVRLHRLLGILYLAIYVYFMWQMIPRLWNYQVEFPARTVVHMVLAMTIGAMLFVKIMIVRFFKHMEASLIPMLGTAVFICTVPLVGMSAPFAYREAHLRKQAAFGDVLDSRNRKRVESLLRFTGLEDEQRRRALASPQALQAGRSVLLTKCIECHDLRTTLVRPRTPENWRQVVRRMADRSTLFNPIEEEEQWQVTSYLIAISPQLQQSTGLRRQQDRSNERSRRAVTAAMQADSAAPYDIELAKQLFETKCSQCHGLDTVDEFSPASAAEARDLISRMVDEGLEGSEQELALINRYLVNRYVE
jgi:hypothetical protein